MLGRLCCPNTRNQTKPEKKMQTFISNAFATNMLVAYPTSVSFTEISPAEAANFVRKGAVSSVGHADTAAVFSQQLGVEVPAQRSTIALNAGDQLVVGSYKGPRLPEGATSLPEGATIRWLLATVG